MTGECTLTEDASCGAVHATACIDAHEGRQLGRQYEATRAHGAATQPQVTTMITGESEAGIPRVVHQTKCVAFGAGDDGATPTTHALTSALKVAQEQRMLTGVSKTQLSNESCLVVSG